MTTTFAVPDVEQELTKFGIADAAIALMAEQYLPLTINGLKDRAGYDAVHSARMIVRSKRTKIEAVRKDLKADALEFGRKVDAEAKRLTALIEPIEKHLNDQEMAIDREREAIRNAEIEAARAKAEAEEKASREAEEKRIADERAAKEAELQAERERLAKERAEMEAERSRLAEVSRKQKEAQDKIDAENARIEQERIDQEEADRKVAEVAAKLKSQREQAALNPAPVAAAPVSAADVSDAIVSSVEDQVGMGSGAWDCVPPKEIVAAAVNACAPERSHVDERYRDLVAACESILDELEDRYDGASNSTHWMGIHIMSLKEALTRAK